MQLEVFKPGKEIIDSDTKESLGTVETHVAIIEVQKVTQTMSYATVIEGDISKISKDLVCRVIKTKKPEIPGSKSNIKRTESGGVVLPFDKK
jgi:hypothetical protein